MRPEAKIFNELSPTEVYEILKARVQIFVVEQKCAYQDIDDIDYKSLHIFYKSGEKITAYLRAFRKIRQINLIKLRHVEHCLVLRHLVFDALLS